MSSMWTLVCSRGARVSLSASSVSTLSMFKSLSMSTIKPLSFAVTDILTVFGDVTEVVLMLLVYDSRIRSTRVGRLHTLTLFIGGTLLGLALSGAVLRVGGS